MYTEQIFLEKEDFSSQFALIPDPNQLYLVTYLLIQTYMRKTNVFFLHFLTCFIICCFFLSPVKHGHGHGWPPVSPATGTAQSDGSMARQCDAYRAGGIWEPEQVNSIYYCHYC